ncbi:hypothetical protein JTE90_026544 [Oedothorax gibbosus]|uniref:Gamma-glutamyltransferase n=1 Tax=Oedothorax gibbosus TaxID=931172 RepID=A0AAV6VSB2_9ARAC|nr:hypothetical protein JTE90_026544 [Oedothorax gibbosus]
MKLFSLLKLGYTTAYAGQVRTYWQEIDMFTKNSAIICKKGSVVSDQPLAASIGIDILKKGGNAADAAVATMAAVSVIQPFSCGFGGDSQCLFYRSSDKTVLAVHGSGRTGKLATLNKLKVAGIKDVKSAEYQDHALWISVPGTVAAMFDIVNYLGSGKLTMEEILAPTIQLAEEGVPISIKNAVVWHGLQSILRRSRNSQDLLVDGKAPKPGDIFKAPKLAQCLKEISKKGPEVFYRGDMAQHITKAVQEAGGVLTLDDLEDHLTHPPISNPTEGIYTDFYGFRVWEMRPNTIGVVALVSLNILKNYDLKALGHNSPEYIHLLSETFKLAYHECWDNLCDPKYSSKAIEEFLTEETAEKIRQRIDPTRAFKSGLCFPSGNTSYVAVVDEFGNGCSLFDSLCNPFGSGIIPDNCGFALHDRPKCMSLEEKSPNAFGPSKLPLHTLMPSVVTDNHTGELLAVLGIMGRFSQPQGQIQVLLNMIEFNMDPQVAINQPRFCLGYPYKHSIYRDSLEHLYLEEGIDSNIIPYLESKGHQCKLCSGLKRLNFGKAHAIARPQLFNHNSMPKNLKTWWSGADPRSDGGAMGF